MNFFLLYTQPYKRGVLVQPLTYVKNTPKYFKLLNPVTRESVNCPIYEIINKHKVTKKGFTIVYLPEYKQYKCVKESEPFTHFNIKYSVLYFDNGKSVVKLTYLNDYGGELDTTYTLKGSNEYYSDPVFILNN